MKQWLTILCWISFVNLSIGQRITVALTGNADFTSIQAAINSIPNDHPEQVEIYIADGLYNEKIYITKSNLRLIGSSSKPTIIQQSIARDSWRCNHPTDWGAATVNVDSCSNVSFEHLTIINAYGMDQPERITIPCTTDSSGQKVVNPTGHQMAFRSFNATRLRFLHCNFKSGGGDTMSPWNTEFGQYYFKNCIFEGGVDLFCPRGWAYAENCLFKATHGSAIIWHDGSGNADAKLVLVHCRFEGFDGFQLGRFHREAQFFLVKCQFASNMADRDIYQVPTTRTLAWGKRVYYAGCQAIGKPYAWCKDNFPAEVDPNSIDASWTFNQTWNP